MRRRPNPYRVLAHALDVGDTRLIELLQARLGRCGRTVAIAAVSPTVAQPPGSHAPEAGAEAVVERLLALLSPGRSPD